MNPLGYFRVEKWQRLSRYALPTALPIPNNGMKRGFLTSQSQTQHSQKHKHKHNIHKNTNTTTTTNANTYTYTYTYTNKTDTSKKFN
jgi:hypothetical protein